MKQILTAIAISASLIGAASPALAQTKPAEPATVSPNDDSNDLQEQSTQAQKNNRARDAQWRKRAAAPVSKMPKKPRSYR